MGSLLHAQKLWVVVGGGGGGGGLEQFSVSPRPLFLGLGLRVWGQGLTINTDHSPEWASLSDEPGHGQGAQRREEQQDRERP